MKKYRDVTKADIGKKCEFWDEYDGDVRGIGVLLDMDRGSFSDSNGIWWDHCRIEVEEVIEESIIPDTPFYITTGKEKVYSCEDSGCEKEPFLIKNLDHVDKNYTTWHRKQMEYNIRSGIWIVIEKPTEQLKGTPNPYVEVPENLTESEALEALKKASDEKLTEGWYLVEHVTSKSISVRYLNHQNRWENSIGGHWSDFFKYEAIHRMEAVK